MQIVGVKIAKLDDINAQIAEMLAKLHDKDEAVVKEAERARTQAKESSQVADATQVNSKSRHDFKPSEKLKSIYRDAVKLIHPDLAQGEEDRLLRTSLMAEINHAYKMGEEKKLRQILEQWKNRPENIIGDNLGAKLIRTIRNISRVKSRLSDIQSEIVVLKESDLYLLRAKVDNAEKESRDLFHDMAMHLDLQIVEQQERLENLLGIFIRSQTRED